MQRGGQLQPVRRVDQLQQVVGLLKNRATAVFNAIQCGH